MTQVISIICFILMIGLVIFIHELGHFLVAKRNGVGVTEFSIGMGPALHSWVKGGTKYCLRLLPLGGYCQLLGQEALFNEDLSEEAEEIDTDAEHAYCNKSVFQRISIIAAGPIFNFLLALLLSVVVTALVGFTPSAISGVADGYPAQEAGLQAGDLITKINDEPMHFFKEVSLYLTLHEGETVNVTYVRNGETKTAELKPVYNEEEARYMIGITSAPRRDCRNAGEIFKYGFYDFGYNCGLVVKSLKILVSGKGSLDDLSGPVGVANVVNDIVEEVEQDTAGESFFVRAYWVLINILNFAAFISANLGIMNLLPIPALDGGKLLLLLVEAVRGKPLSRKTEGIITIIGVVLMLLLVAVVFFNDIRKVFFR